jgi:hypothetical protein
LEAAAAAPTPAGCKTFGRPPHLRILAINSNLFAR